MALRIVSDINEAQELLQAPVVAFDIETDTGEYHWGKNKKRGLSYPADMTHISFFAGPEYPLLVLTATRECVPYTYEEFQWSPEGEPHFVELPGEKWQYRFTSEEVDFIRALFHRPDEYPVVAVAHNLTFDARQVFGKFGLDPYHPNLTLWDTQVVEVGGCYPGYEVGPDPSFALEDTIKRHVSEQTASWLEELGSDDFVSYMKSQRKNLADINPVTIVTSFPVDRYDFSDFIETDEEREAVEQLSALSAAYRAAGKGETAPITRQIKKAIPAAEGALKRTLDYFIERYVAWDSVAAFIVQQSQAANNPYKDFHEKILPADLEYTRWTVDASAKGVRFNMPYAKQRVLEVAGEWREALIGLGFDPLDYLEEDEKPWGKKEWQEGYIFSRVDFDNIDENTVKKYGLVTKSGNKSLNKKALKFYMEEYPDLADFARWKRLDHGLSDLLSFIRHAEFDGRIHSVISRLADTGRNRSDNPNMQNRSFPDAKDQEAGAVSFAGMLIGDPGKVLIEMDLSGAENYMQAMYGADDAAARENVEVDRHSARAKRFFPDMWVEDDPAVRKRLRSMAKTIGFSDDYGSGDEALAVALGWTVERVKAFRESMKALYPGITQSKDKSKAFSQKFGFVRTWFGRRIRTVCDNKYGRWNRKTYTAWNNLAQGGVACYMTLVINNMARWLLENNCRTRIALMVHDSIIVEMDVEEYRQIAVPLIEIMSSQMPEEWLSRTTPKIRWLVDIDHQGNAKKWGYNPLAEYPFDTDEYVNRWGFHSLRERGEKATPTWINEYGYGEAAIAKELGEDYEEPQDATKPMLEASDPAAMKAEPADFDWANFQAAVAAASKLTQTPLEWNHRLFEFPSAMPLLRALAHKGIDDETYTRYLRILDAAAQQFEMYARWRKGRNESV